MAELRNDSGALRWALALVAWEHDGERVLASVAVESLDQRDREWWPLVRLPPVHLSGQALARLSSDLTELLRGATSGFAWSPAGASLGLQVGALPGGAQLELGLDLGGFLADNAGVPLRAEADLALFRWRVRQEDLVLFADALARELEALPR
jgi:hypothetical protein